VALPYEGYVLNDLANALGVEARLTVDYTAALPVDKGFQGLAFDDLPCHYTNSGEEVRGYHLKNAKVRKNKATAEKFDEKAGMEGDIAYRCNPVLQFNAFTKRAHQLADEAKLVVSPERLESLGLSEGDRVKVTLPSGSVELAVATDKFIGGDIVMVPDFDPSIGADKLFADNRFQNVTIEKV
jgi:NADH-quinone oxidoreductase subunit G